MYPIWFVILGIVIFGIGYYYYGRYVDRKIMKADPKTETPAHKYLDGISFFPTSRSVLYGFQFQSIAGLGPVFGPFIALFFGWLPALIWILAGNFFIGWLHDYSVTFTSVRSEGKTLGPLLHDFVSPRARKSMIFFLFFYLILITSVFLLLIALFLNLYPSALWPLVALIVGGSILGWMLYTARIMVTWSTVVGLIILAVGVIAGIYFGFPKWTFVTWLAIVTVLFWITSQLPTMRFTHPTIFLATWFALFGLALVFIGALVSPATGVNIKTAAWGGIFGFKKGFWSPGPIFPLLTVSIACGAISGWHCLVGSCATSRNVDVETDILPVSGGAMFTEGLVALAALTMFMVIPGVEALKLFKWGAIVEGAKVLITPWMGGEVFIDTYFPAWLIFFAFTIQLLLVRFYTVVMVGLVGGRSSSNTSEGISISDALRALLTNRFIAPALLLFIGALFAWSGAWINLWLLFGGSNQAMAGIGLLLVTIYLAKAKRPTKYTLFPAIFMVITTGSALLWEAIKFMLAGISGAMGGKVLFSGFWAIKGPIAKAGMAAHPSLASGFNIVFGIIGFILFAIVIIITYDSLKAFRKVKKA